MLKKNHPSSAGCNLGEVHTAFFDNGLRIYVKEKHDAPTVNIQAWVKTGSIHEGEYLGCGLSHFLEHMMFQGTEKYPGHEIAGTVHRCGGHINAYTSFGKTVYYIKLPSEHFEKAADMLCDVMTSPAFPDSKFKEEKNVILRERDMVNDSPGRVISEKLWLNIFRVHPVRHPIIGYRDSIQSVDASMMKDYYRKRYSPMRSFFVISGDIDAASVISFFEKRLASWPVGNISDTALPEEPGQVCMKSAEYFFPDPLARLSLGFRIPEASHPDVPALDILAGIIGQNRSSRLVRKFKLDKQLAININSFCYTPYFCGVFSIGATCAPEKRQRFKKELFAEIKKIASGRISRAELSREINQQSLGFIRTMRSNSGIAQLMGNTVLTYGSPDYADKYLDDISKLRPEDIERVAAGYLDPDNSTLIELLPENASPVRQSSKPVSGRGAKPSMKKLKSGHRIITYVDKTLPLVDINLVIPGGVIFETPRNAGISRLVSSLLPAGTSKYTEEQINEILDDNAIDLNVSSGNNSIVFKLGCRKECLDTGLAVLKSVICEPIFPENKFRREKDNTLEVLKSRKLSPQQAAQDRLCELLYGAHPYALPSEGLEKSVKSLKVSDLKKFYFEKCLVPEKAVFGIAGDIEKASLVEKLSAICDNPVWKKSKRTELVPEPEFPDAPVKDLVNVPREQAVVMMGFPCCDITHPDKYVIDILQQAMNGQASRLFEEVREKAGLAYYTGLFSSRGMQKGFLAFYAGTHPGASEKVISIIMREIKHLAGKGFSEKEFEEARSCLYFAVSEQIENIEVLIFNSALSEYYGNGFEEPWTFDDKIRGIDYSDACDVIRKYMSSKAFVTVTASPPEKSELYRDAKQQY